MWREPNSAKVRNERRRFYATLCGNIASSAVFATVGYGLAIVLGIGLTESGWWQNATLALLLVGFAGVLIINAESLLHQLEDENS